MYEDRIGLYRQLEEKFDSKLLVYFTGDRSGMETQIAKDAVDFFIKQLDEISVCDRLSLLLYTCGGDIAAAWNIINLLKMFCDELQIIIPHKAHSAGTLIALGANEIVMTKQATLGPIDPSVNTPLNPRIPNNNGAFPVSVEDANGYLEFAKNELNITEPALLSATFMKLSDNVHPLVLGRVYRIRAQIQMLAKKLLAKHIEDAGQIDKIISFLCSETGSHDYTINRREAKDTLGLNVRKPTEDEYCLIRDIYNDISDELMLTTAFNPNVINGEYIARRCVIESIKGGADYFVTEGSISKKMLQDGRVVTSVENVFEGWRHEKCSESDLAQAKTKEGETVNEYAVDGQFKM